MYSSSGTPLKWKGWGILYIVRGFVLPFKVLYPFKASEKILVKNVMRVDFILFSKQLRVDVVL